VGVLGRGLEGGNCVGEGGGDGCWDGSGSWAVGGWMTGGWIDGMNG
jgi:hypothetical protein